MFTCSLFNIDFGIGLVMKGLFPLPLACLIVGRDLSLIAASFALRAIERPAGSHFFDTTDSATFNIVPSELSKVKFNLYFDSILFNLLYYRYLSTSYYRLIQQCNLVCLVQHYVTLLLTLPVWYS